MNIPLLEFFDKASYPVKLAAQYAFDKHYKSFKNEYEQLNARKMELGTGVMLDEATNLHGVIVAQTTDYKVYLVLTDIIGDEYHIVVAESQRAFENVANPSLN